MKKQMIIVTLILMVVAIVFSSKVNAATPKAIIYIDFPAQNQTVNNKLNIHGWYLSEVADKSLKFYIDDTKNELKVGDIYYPRDNVVEVMKGQGYGTLAENKKCGFDTTIDISNVTDGKHTLIVQTIDNKTGAKIGAEAKQTFNVKKYKTSLCIDWPIVGKTYGTTVDIHGWYLSNFKDKEIKIYLKDSTTNQTTDVTSQIKTYKREDPITAMKGQGYGSLAENPEAGFDGKVSTVNLKDGKHKIIVKVINKVTKDVMAQEEREFSLKKYNTSLCIDWPVVGTTYGKTVDVHGWYLSNFKDKEIKIYLKDGTTNQTTDVTSQVSTYKREDPINAMKGKGYGTLAENPEAGFDGKVSTANLKDGKHKIIVKVINKVTQDVMAQEEREFIYEKYKTSMYIDYPSNGQNYRNTLKIHGWVMSEEPNKKIRFFLNNTEITNKVNLIKRDDVIKGVVGYGTEKENPQPGFDATINVAGYTSGTYTFKVEVYSNTTGRLLKSDSTTFTLNIFTYNSGAFGISGLKEYNRAQGGDLTYYRIGDGNNVLFAVFSTHGFEDSWYKDGQELTDIAEKCIAHLREFQTNYQDILNNWTIYIIPKLNYDGQTFGWTNNGPGRTTIHSNAPGTKGIDLNRCWSVSYKSYSDSRNYNGTAPFQACEARYLRDFILSYKAQRGKTIVVDLHGWLNETIGDNGLGWFYRDRFGISEHIGTYGGGYLINWARTLSNTRSVLVELPMITSHSQALNRQFAEKYIQATTNMLRNS